MNRAGGAAAPIDGPPENVPLRGEIPTAPSTQGAQVVGRIFDILDLFESHGPRLTVTDVSRALSLKYATAHRLLDAMAARGVLVREPETLRYRLGPRLREIVIRGSNDEIAELKRELEALSKRTGESSHVAVLEGGAAIYVESVAGGHLLSPHIHVGHRMPLHCTGVGKALLAWLPLDQRDALLPRVLERHTPHTIVSRRGLRDELEAIRERGYAIDDEETEDGLVCIAAPVFDHAGRCVAALSASGLASRLRDSRARVAEQVVASAERIRWITVWLAAGRSSVEVGGRSRDRES